MNSNEKNIGIISKVLLVIAGMLLITSLFYPIWRIELDAPQYPEGLALTIHANKIGGEVEIINGLNHYIGMKTLHAEEFIEFTVLPYIISGYALACLLVVFVRKKKALNVLFGAFVLFGIIAMVDFWRWEYNYGHNLDPSAAIIVPGMAYQPPLIGFKQLLNFGAYSIPDIGGWLFIISGLLMAAAVVLEYRKAKKLIKQSLAAVVLPIILFSFSSCEPSKPDAIKLNSDNCDNCGMTISNPKFATVLFTTKGRTYKFDDISCLLDYKNENKERTNGAALYVANFLGENQLLPVETAIYVKGENVKSPMGGNIAAFENKENATKYAADVSAEFIDWNTINK
ncbi:MAG: nitrous oxide reductase accessory protein NosL [Sphingobacteriaceae bacterium]|nr:nitrous oxide reductase accessory protein NosL [Sphingobacteriaceae bacterium]